MRPVLKYAALVMAVVFASWLLVSGIQIHHSLQDVASAGYTFSVVVVDEVASDRPVAHLADEHLRELPQPIADAIREAAAVGKSETSVTSEDFQRWQAFRNGLTPADASVYQYDGHLLLIAARTV